MIEKKECSICGNIDITEIVSLGDSPPANNFVNHADEIVESFPHFRNKRVFFDGAL